MPVWAESAASFLPIASSMIGRIDHHQAYNEVIGAISISRRPDRNIYFDGTLYAHLIFQRNIST